MWLAKYDAQYPKHRKANSYDLESLIMVRETETLCVDTGAFSRSKAKRCDASTHNTAFLIHCRIAKPMGGISLVRNDSRKGGANGYRNGAVR